MKDRMQENGEKAIVIGHTILQFDEIDSTNTYVKGLALEGGAEGTVVMAEVQTAGRGRMGRSFQSPKGKGIYLSVLLRPDVPAERLASVTALAGIAVCDAVEAVCGVRPGLKWPNDPVMGNKKLCGILTEAVTAPDGKTALILGIGINVLQTEEDFGPEIRSIATSLLTELGRSVSREKLTECLLDRLEQVYLALKDGNLSRWVETYRKDCVHLGRKIRLNGPNGQELVTALNVDESFGLVVADADGTVRTIRSGEVSVRGLYGYTE